MINDLGLQKNYTIKELPSTERPREKLYIHGPQALSNEELIAKIGRASCRERV